MNDIVKQIIQGVIIILVAGLLMGSYSLYSDVSENTASRIKNEQVLEEIHLIQKDVCWIKGFLRGEKIPSCN